MKMMIIKFVLAVLVVFSLFAQNETIKQEFEKGSISSTNVQGRIMQYTEKGEFPLSFVYVSLTESLTGQKISTVYAGSNGVYQFLNIEPGDYIISIWVDGLDREPVKYGIVAEKKSLTYIYPIVVNLFKFAGIPKQNRVKAQEPVVLTGEHSFPENSQIILVFEDLKKNLYTTYSSVKLLRNGRWRSDSMLMPPDLKIIHAVVINYDKKPSDLKMNMMHANAPELKQIDALPENGSIISSIKTEIKEEKDH